MDRVLDKIFSGRFISTVFIVGTYCFIMLIFSLLIKDGKIDMDQFNTIFLGFALLAKDIVQAYFDRTDRNKEKPNV